jgi:hypothetical protein
MADEPEGATALVTATITAELPHRLYRVTTDDGDLITAGASPDAARLGIPFRLGMSVTVQRARLDPSRGTILGPARASKP